MIIVALDMIFCDCDCECQSPKGLASHIAYHINSYPIAINDLTLQSHERCYFVISNLLWWNKTFCCGSLQKYLALIICELWLIIVGLHRWLGSDYHLMLITKDFFQLFNLKRPTMPRFTMIMIVLMIDKFIEQNKIQTQWNHLSKLISKRSKQINIK